MYQFKQRNWKKYTLGIFGHTDLMTFQVGTFFDAGPGAERTKTSNVGGIKLSSHLDKLVSKNCLFLEQSPNALLNKEKVGYIHKCLYVFSFVIDVEIYLGTNCHKSG
jgi:hypothetical protein